MSQNPAIAREALAPSPRVVGALTLQPVTLGTVLVLEKIGSPLLTAKPGDAVSALELFRTVYVLTHPVDEVLALHARGAAAFDTTVIQWASQVTIADLEPLTRAVIEHLAAAFAPSAQLSPPRQEGVEDVPLPSGTRSATGLAGSST